MAFLLKSGKYWYIAKMVKVGAKWTNMILKPLGAISRDEAEAEGQQLSV